MIGKQTTTTPATPPPSGRIQPLPARPAASLPADGNYDIGSTTLVGHRRYVDGKKTGRPVLWTTDAVLPDAGSAWIRLIDRFSSTGLYPVVLQADETDLDGTGRPWLTGEFVLDPHTDPDRIGSPSALFAGLYKNALRDFVTGDLPTQTLPPLTARHTGGPDQDAARAQVAGLPGRIGLVAVARPADVPVAIGWLGATNYFDGGVVTAVLRSWEDRYGTQLIRMGADYLQVSVPDPPQTLAEARRIALEHVAFCGDQVYQEAAGFDDFSRSLVGAKSWFCWWD